MKGLKRGRYNNVDCRHKAEYLRRVSCVSGKECDGTLREVGLFTRSNKVVPQVNTLSLI